MIIRNTHRSTLPPKCSTILNVRSILSTANVVRTAMLTLASSEPLDPHAWTRQPSGTWMNAPLRAIPFRNMWIVLAGLLLLLPLVWADEEAGGLKVVHSHCSESIQISHSIRCVRVDQGPQNKSTS